MIDARRSLEAVHKEVVAAVRQRLLARQGLGMGFEQFRGNATTVGRLREMIARDHLPHAIILTGARGAGKFTLAQMVAKAVNCLERPIAEDGLPDFCGRCRNCERIAPGRRPGPALCRSRGGP